MKSTLRRPLAIGVSALIASGAAVVGLSVPASAGTAGTITNITPSPNNTGINPTLTTSGLCSNDANANARVQVFMSGPNITAANGISVVGVSQAALYNGSGTNYVIPLSNTLDTIASLNGFTYAPNGVYTFKIVCRTSTLPADLGNFDGTITINSAGNQYTFNAPAQPASSVTLAASPASPQQFGTSVTLTASTGPSGTAGAVQFKDGAANLGSPVTVSGNQAVLATTALAVGSHSLTAVFTPTSGFAPSTSTALPYTIAAAAATVTTTTLTVNPTSAAAYTPVNFSATISPSAAGTVAFKEGSTTLATGTVAAGVATGSFGNFAAGTHTVVAYFTPADSGAFQASQSAAVDHTATAPAFAPDPQDIEVTVAPGTLVINTPYTSTNPLNLGVMTLNPGATMLSANALFDDILITDTRSGGPSWTASASSGNLASGTDLINSQNVGLTNLTGIYTPGNAIQSGDVLFTDNAAAAGVAPTAAGSAGLGGGVQHAFATTAPGSGIGTVELNGTLTVNAPTSTVAGTYKGIVTFTIA